MQLFTTGAGEKALWGGSCNGKDSITASWKQETALRERELNGWQEDPANWDANDSEDKQVLSVSFSSTEILLFLKTA